MKLRLQIVDAGAGPVLALVDDEGQLLPCQTSVIVSSEVGKPVMATVKFLVDGDELKLSERGAGKPGPSRPTTIA